MIVSIRKLIVQVDETRIEMGRPVQPPTRRAVAMAVIDNPYAGRYSEDLESLYSIGEELGQLLGARCVAALGIQPDQAQSYGKAAIVGEAGELEHAAAILHPKLGATLRREVSQGAALVPSAKKMGGLGTAIDVPRRNEIVVAIAVTDSGRPLARVGGLKSADIQGTDGLR
jgi:hypothetical protein